MVWQPPNLTEICPPQSPLLACSGFGLVYLNLLVQLYGGSVDQEKKEMCVKEKNCKYVDRKLYDFIVVGAGAAGCVVAHRLTENPKWKVLLLEAGSEEPNVTSVPTFSTAVLSSSLDWQYTSEPNGKSCLAHPGGRCPLPRGKTMGGSTAINSLAYIRGHKEDYDTWDRLGNKGWSYDDVLPYFKKSERNLNIEALDSKYHGVKGEQYVSWYPYLDKPSQILTEAFNQGGLPFTDFNGAQQVGAMQAQTISVEGERASTNVAFIRPVRYQRPNLYIETDAEATKILIDKSKNAYGIVYFKNGTKYRAYATKEVIVSCGAINSPKLLMLSGIGPQEHLESLNIPVVQDLPVGKNLHDHVPIDGILVALSNKTATSVSEDEILSAIKEFAKMKFKRGPLLGNGAASTLGFMKTESNLIAPDIQFHTNGISNWREYIQDPILAQRTDIFPTVFYDSFVPRPMNLVPFSRGEVQLNKTDPNSAPLFCLNYFDDERDLIPLLKAIRFLLSLENTEAFRSLGAYYVREKFPLCESYEWGTDEYYICLAKNYTSTTHHPVGTCKMGPKKDKSAVLDNELRVYGVKSLRVIDASIMPVIVRGNTVAPSIMIGERGVDFVIKYWRNHTKNYC